MRVGEVWRLKSSVDDPHPGKQRIEIIAKNDDESWKILREDGWEDNYPISYITSAYQKDYDASR